MVALIKHPQERRDGNGPALPASPAKKRNKRFYSGGGGGGAEGVSPPGIAQPQSGAGGKGAARAEGRPPQPRPAPQPCPINPLPLRPLVLPPRFTVFSSLPPVHGFFFFFPPPHPFARGCCAAAEPSAWSPSAAVVSGWSLGLGGGLWGSQLDGGVPSVQSSCWRGSSGIPRLGCLC